MTAALRDRPAHAGAPNGGVPARRAVARWAWRLLRREWRQQALILGLIIVAVAATVVGATVATTTRTPAGAGFGTASDLATYPAPGPHLAAQIASLKHRFGRVDVIENQTLPVPGSVRTYDLRAQNPHGPFGQPMLSLVRGRYPAGPGQVAVTTGVAAEFHLTLGGTWHVGAAARKVTGIVRNPQNFADSFALVAPGQVTAPTQVTVLFDAPGASPSAIGPNVASVSQAAAAATNVINPDTISLAAATLGMALIALVGVGGFTAAAQRRLRSIGMLGAQGATDSHIGLVIRANGLATGVIGALAGFGAGLLAWLAYRPQAEASAQHVIGALQLPWAVIAVSMILAVAATYAAAARPARAIARMPLVAALAGRPAPPKPVRRWAAPAGLALLIAAFLLLGAAGASGGNGSGLGQLAIGLIAVAVAVVLLSPACLALLAKAAGRAPVAVRLALRDLARYRARSGPALGAIAISVLIAAITCVVAAARFGNVLDYAGPNLAPNQLIVYSSSPAAPNRPTDNGPSPSGPGTAGGSQQPGKTSPQKSPGPTTAQPTRSLASLTAGAHRIAASLGARDTITLESAGATLQRAAAGRNWNGPLYVATPHLLAAFGIKATQVDPGADILTMRPGLSGMSKMRLLHGNFANALGPPRQNANSYPCPASVCLANPPIQEVSALPAGTSAPNTVVTSHAVRTLHLATSVSGWLIQTPGALTASQIAAARQAAGADGMRVETRNAIPALSQIIDAATVFGIALALGILAMSVGLVRSEAGSDLRTLAATGASGATRRAITAATAGALALTGAVVGTACGYLAAIGFFRTNHLDGLSSLASIPVANLALILVGMPVFAMVAGWLLGGREPHALGRQPLP